MGSSLEPGEVAWPSHWCQVRQNRRVDTKAKERRSSLMSAAAALLDRLGRPGDLRLAAGIAGLDDALAGGLPRGRVTELVGRRSTGRTGLACAILARATRAGEVVALVDVDDAFDAETGAAAGVVLERLLWTRPLRLVDAFRAAELLLAAGGFGLVVLDAGERGGAERNGAARRRAAPANRLARGAGRRGRGPARPLERRAGTRRPPRRAPVRGPRRADARRPAGAERRPEAGLCLSGARATPRLPRRSRSARRRALPRRSRPRRPR